MMGSVLGMAGPVSVWWLGESERETDRERERERQRERDRQTDRQRDRQTDRQRDRQRESESGGTNFCLKVLVCRPTSVRADLNLRYTGMLLGCYAANNGCLTLLHLLWPDLLISLCFSFLSFLFSLPHHLHTNTPFSPHSRGNKCFLSYLTYPVVWLTVAAPLFILQPASSTPRGSRLSKVVYSRPVHSLMLSSHRFLEGSIDNQPSAGFHATGFEAGYEEFPC